MHSIILVLLTNILNASQSQDWSHCCNGEFGVLCIFAIKIKSNFSLHSLLYAEACNKFAGPISASLHPHNIATFEEMLQRWRAFGNTVSDLTGSRFEPRPPAPETNVSYRSTYNTILIIAKALYRVF